MDDHRCERSMSMGERDVILLNDRIPFFDDMRVACKAFIVVRKKCILPDDI